MKRFLLCLLPLFVLGVVIQTMVINPLSELPARRGAAIAEVKGVAMPLNAASLPNTVPNEQEPEQEVISVNAGVEDGNTAPLLCSNVAGGTEEVKEVEEGEQEAPKEDPLAPYTAKVTRVYDGDTFVVDKGGESVKIRLAAIDAPELKQTDGVLSQEKLSELLSNKEVSIEPVAVDRYGRVVAFVKVGEVELNKLMIDSGLAWFYVAYSYGHDYSDAMTFAKNNKIGLWKKQGVIPPALYRKLVQLGKLGENIMKNGLYLDSKGILHNKNFKCNGEVTNRNRWDGLSAYENCPVCYGAIYDANGYLSQYVKDSDVVKEFVEDSFDPDDITDAELETHMKTEAMPDMEQVQQKGLTELKSAMGFSETSTNGTCSTGTCPTGTCPTGACSGSYYPYSGYGGYGSGCSSGCCGGGCW